MSADIRFPEEFTPYGAYLFNRYPNRGFTCTNIDYSVFNWKSKEWLYLEEKRHQGVPSETQIQQFELLDTLARATPSQWAYRGFFIVQFEHDKPDDGLIWVDGIETTEQELDDLLLFKNHVMLATKEPGVMFNAHHRFGKEQEDAMATLKASKP